MKKFFSLLLLLTITINLFAYNVETTKALTVQAGFDEVIEFSIVPIVSQAEAFSIGMPFNIEDAYIQYKEGASGDDYKGSGSGRVIANWSMLFNTPVKISIDTKPLKYVGSDADQKTDLGELTYSIAFDCNLAYYKDGEFQDINIYIIYSGDAGTAYIYNADTGVVYTAPDTEKNTISFKSLLNDNGITPGSNSYVGNAQGLVFFGLTDEATKALKGDIKYERYPIGEYQGTVTVYLEADNE